MTFLETALKFLASNYGGTLLSFVLIGWLFWRDRACEVRAATDRRYIDNLTHVVIQLHTAIQSLGGRRQIKIEGLEKLLQRERVPSVLTSDDYDGHDRRQP